LGGFDAAAVGLCGAYSQAAAAAATAIDMAYRRSFL